MGKRHHYVPCLITGNWGSEEAAKLLPPDPPAYERGRCTASASVKRRNRYVCVFSKRAQTSRASPADEVFVRTELYSLPTYPDRLREGLLRVFVAKQAGLSVPEAASRGVIEALASVPLDRDFPDNDLCQHEHRAATVLDRIAKTGVIAPKDRLFVEQFVAFSNFRTPDWRDANVNAYATRAHQNAIANLGPFGDREVWAALRSVLGDTLHAVAAMSFADHPSPFHLVNDLCVAVLRAPPGCGFVIGDNPGIAFLYTRASASPDAHQHRRVGMNRAPDVGIVYPLRPDTALLLATGQHPLHGQSILDEAQVRMVNTANAALAFDEIVFPTADFDSHLLLPVRSLAPWVDRSAQEARV